MAEFGDKDLSHLEREGHEILSYAHTMYVYT